MQTSAALQSALSQLSSQKANQQNPLLIGTVQLRGLPVVTAALAAGGAAALPATPKGYVAVLLQGSDGTDYGTVYLPFYQA